MPLLIAVPDSFSNLWFIALPLIIFMVILLICFGLFFILNYRLFSLLEKEDWPALAYYLEQKVLVKGRYTDRNVRLLASSYMVITDYYSVLKLENKASLANPSVIDKNILIFGSARVLSGKYEEAAAFFKTRLDKGNVKKNDREWVHWFFGFSHLLNGSFSKAEVEFLQLAYKAHGALVAGLSAYFLYNNVAKYSLKPRECTAAAEKGQERILKALKTRAEWKKEIEKSAEEIHIAIIRKYIDETENWIYQKK